MVTIHERFHWQDAYLTCAQATKNEIQPWDNVEGDARFEIYSFLVWLIQTHNILSPVNMSSSF